MSRMVTTTLGMGCRLSKHLAPISIPHGLDLVIVCGVGVGGKTHRSTRSHDPRRHLLSSTSVSRTAYWISTSQALPIRTQTRYLPDRWYTIKAVGLTLAEHGTEISRSWLYPCTSRVGQKRPSLYTRRVSQPGVLTRCWRDTTNDGM